MSRRRKRFLDKRKAAVKPVHRFDPNETWKERHTRRLATASRAGCLKFATEEIEALGLTLSVHNGGHHWIIRSGGAIVAEWWPSSAKLVFRKRWRDGVHTHDVIQLVAELRRLVECDRTQVG